MKPTTQTRPALAFVGQTSGLPVQGTSGSLSPSAPPPATTGHQRWPKPADRRSAPQVAPRAAVVGSAAAPSRLVSGFHSRGALPHLKRAGAAYFVTFRLAGTLPRELLLSLKQERQRILLRAEAQKRPLTWQEQQTLFNWYANRVDAVLDAGGAGACWMRRPEVADLVQQAIRHFEGPRYALPAWVIMPNHVHAVVRPESPHTLSTILKSWKSYTGLHANRLLGREGRPFWQTESYDHLCRDDDLAKCCAYTVSNPVIAGLCCTPEEWPWSSAHSERPVGQTSGLPVPGTSGSEGLRTSDTRP